MFFLFLIREKNPIVLYTLESRYILPHGWTLKACYLKDVRTEDHILCNFVHTECSELANA